MTDDTPQDQPAPDPAALFASAFGPGGRPTALPSPAKKKRKPRAPLGAEVPVLLDPSFPAPVTENNDAGVAMQETQGGDDFEGEDAGEGEGADDPDALLESEATDATAPPPVFPASAPVDPGPCPVKALGRANGLFYFASAAGEIRDLKAKELLSVAGLADLFDGTTTWLELKFPRIGKEGEVVKGEFHNNRAGRHLIRECARLALWDPQVSIRGRGVWIQGDPSDPAALVIVHCGDDVLIGGKWHKPGFRRAGVLYRAMPPIAPPAEKPAPAEIGQELVRILSRWNWQDANAPMVVAGLIATSMLGAAKPWNPHGLVVAEPGSGKSTLAELLEGVMPLADYYDEFSSAGLRQALTGEARSVILDEAEGGSDPHGAVAQAIELIRRLSSAKGLQSVRGSSEGKAQRFTATGSAILLAVLPPELQPADRTRITRLDLRRLDAKADADELRKDIAEISKHGLALWARMLAMRPVYLENLARVRKALAAIECSPREQDQPGAIIAGAATLEQDAPLTDDEAGKLVRACSFIINRQASDDLEGGPMRALNHVLGSQPEAWSSGTKRAIGQVLELIRTRIDGLLVEQLAATGIRVAFAPNAPERVGIWIANRHPQLARIFAGTPWAGNKWADDLRRLPGAEPAPDPIRIGGAKVRAIFVPNELLPEVMSDDDRKRLHVAAPGAPP